METNATFGGVTAIPSIPNKSHQINELAQALCVAQGELESIGKNEKGYGYNYSSLADTIALVKPVLAAHGLSYTQLTEVDGNGRPQITTILMHTSGQYIQSTASMDLVEMKSCNTAQRAGAVYTYLRRYGLQAILGLSSEDNDASSNGSTKPASSSKFSTKKAEPKAGKASTGEKRKKFQRKEVVEDDI
jgi:hypothetical protein